MSIRVSTEARSASVEAVITRADGTVENLGVISYHHNNPFKRWAVNLWIFWKQLARRN